MLCLAYYTSVVNGWSQYTLLLPVAFALLMWLYRHVTQKDKKFLRGYSNLSLLSESIYLSDEYKPVSANEYLSSLWNKLIDVAGIKVPINFYLYVGYGDSEVKRELIGVKSEDGVNKLFLSKTNVRRYTAEVLLGIFAHELYHLSYEPRWLRKLCIALIFLQSLTMLYLFFSLIAINGWLVFAHFLLSLLGSFLLYAPLREVEFEADQFAKTLGFGNEFASYLKSREGTVQFPTHPMIKSRLERLSYEINTHFWWVFFGFLGMV